MDKSCMRIKKLQHRYNWPSCCFPQVNMHLHSVISPYKSRIKSKTKNINRINFRNVIVREIINEDVLDGGWNVPRMTKMI